MIYIYIFIYLFYLFISLHSYIIENKRYYTLITVYIGLTQIGDMYGVMVY